jgi:hypothetical protein
VSSARDERPHALSLSERCAKKAFLITDQAFLQARAQWREHYGQARREDSRVGNSGAVHPPVTPSEALDYLEVQVFATDISRYIQLLTTRRHLEIGGPEPDEVETRSALLFVFDWILSWEVFAAGYPTERYAEYWTSTT